MRTTQAMAVVGLFFASAAAGADLRFFSGTDGSGGCAGTPDSVYVSENSGCVAAKTFTCWLVDTAHSGVTLELFTSIDCTSGQRSWPLSDENRGKQQSDFKPYHSYRFSSNKSSKRDAAGRDVNEDALQEEGSVLGERIPSPVDPTSTSWSVGGVRYVVRRAIYSGFAVGTYQAIQAIVNQLNTADDGQAETEFGDGQDWAVLWGVTGPAGLPVLQDIFRTVAEYATSNGHQMEFEYFVEDSAGNQIAHYISGIA